MAKVVTSRSSSSFLASTSFGLSQKRRHFQGACPTTTTKTKKKFFRNTCFRLCAEDGSENLVDPEATTSSTSSFPWTSLSVPVYSLATIGAGAGAEGGGNTS